MHRRHGEWRNGAKQSFTRTRSWPVAGPQVEEVDVTLLTFKIRSDRLVWCEQLGEPAVSGRPIAAAGQRQLRSIPFSIFGV